MVFLGSKRYPGESQFEEFLSENGGESNAYTECEYTCSLSEKSHVPKHVDIVWINGKSTRPILRGQPEGWTFIEMLQLKCFKHRISKALHQALHMFAELLHEPLFTPDASSRELQAEWASGAV